MSQSNSSKYTVEAIFAARRLVLEYKRKNGGLKPPIQVTAMKNPSGWGDRKYISGLFDAASGLTESRIDIVEFSPLPEDNPVNAFVLSTTGGKKVIFVADYSNFCWKRFYSCKELCHAVMDDSEKLRTSGAEACQSLISDLKSPPLPNEESYPAYETEYAAYLGAIEMLLPPEFFPDIEHAKASLPAYEIALKYRVPRFVIEQILIEGSVLMRLIVRVRENQHYRNLELV